MIANLVEIKCHEFFRIGLLLSPLWSHVIGTFQERAIYDAL